MITKTKALFNDAGNCIFCSEAGRCPGYHDWSELNGRTFSNQEIYDLLPLSEKTLLRRLRYKIYPFKLKNDRGYPCDYFIYDENDEPTGVVVYYRGRKLCLHGIEKNCKNKKEQN